jgi:diadenosine tetraphosphate (Ap4A) HIT family hydrolase
MTDKNCIFCKILRGEADSFVIWEDMKHVAFLSIFPNTRGATVVIPKAHVPSYAFDAENNILTDLVLAAKTVAKLLDAKLDGVARTAMVFEGYGVDHLHAKLFPMHGTGADSRFRPIHSNVNKYFDNYEGYISSHDWKRADDRELGELARFLRTDNV